MKIKILSISKNEDFKELLKGKKVSNYYTTIFFKKLSRENNSNLKVSFVVKKKIGSAVFRNKIKRRLRNIMRDAIKNIKINLAYSYLFIAKKNVFDDEYKLIKKNIFNELEKIK